MKEVDTDELKKEQTKLSEKIELNDGFEEIEKIGGVDQSYNNGKVVSCFIVCDYETMDVVEKSVVVEEAPIKYIPGFLAYREMPAAVSAYEKLDTVPDVILVDGHGIAHPRKLGLASHLGLSLNKPSIGVAKNLMREAEVEDGKIYIDKDMRGFEAVTKEHANPVYVSPGHKVSFGTSLNIVKKCVREPHKMPEPIHLSHRGAKDKIKELRED